MRFDRREKPPQFSWTARKLALFRSRAARRKAKLDKDYPLFADQIPIPPALSEADEAARRQADLIRTEQRWRDLMAAHWRHGRRQYFACDVDLREQIRQAWVAWRGPATPGYFIYVVEQHNGKAAERARIAAQESRRIRLAVLLDLQRNAALDFVGESNHGR
jgi:uncharacterized protein YbdZ (MbtH family)